MQSHNVQVIPKLLELDMNTRFCEDVGSHASSRDIDQLNIAGGDSLTDEVEMHINMLGMAVEGGILG